MRRSVCIIGGGLAGGIVASTLAAREHSVTIVELGDAPAPLVPSSEIWEGTGVKTLFTRGSGIGGTSNFWHGGLAILDRTDVDGMPDHHRRPRAPIAYGQLREYYAQAVALIRDGKPYSLDDIETPLDVPLCGFCDTAEIVNLKAHLYPHRPFSTPVLTERAIEVTRLPVGPTSGTKQLV